MSQRADASRGEGRSGGMVRGSRLLRLAQQLGEKGAGGPPGGKGKVEKVSGFVAFVPAASTQPSKGSVSATRMVWLPYLWLAERGLAFARGGWLRSYKIQRVALVVLCITVSLSNYNNRVLFEG